MTEETKLALQQATEAQAAAEAEATKQKRACMEQIAADLPARAVEIAKLVAKKEPDLTQRLGREGIAEMRTELSEAASELGQHFVNAVNDIQWPAAGHFQTIGTREIQTAVTRQFLGRTGSLTRVLEVRGYKPGYDTFQPDSLYDPSTFGPLAEALNALGRVQGQFKRAKKQDNDSTVDDLWD